MSITVTIFAFAAAAATGSIGLKQAVDAVNNHSNAKKIVVKASEKYEQSVNKLEIKREEVSSLLEKVGELKINILKNSVNDFLTTFEKIKNVEIRDSSGLRELYDINIDKIDKQQRYIPYPIICSIRNSTQYSLITYMTKISEKEYV